MIEDALIRGVKSYEANPDGLTDTVKITFDNGYDITVATSDSEGSSFLLWEIDKGLAVGIHMAQCPRCNCNYWEGNFDIDSINQPDIDYMLGRLVEQTISLNQRGFASSGTEEGKFYKITDPIVSSKEFQNLREQLQAGTVVLQEEPQ